VSKSRKPLELQTGNLTVLQKEKKRLEEEYVRTGKNQLNSPPRWLIDEIAIKEFKRLVKELRNIEIIGNLDLNNLGAYCNAFSMYIKATEAMNKMPLLIKKTMPNGSSNIVENPAIKIQKKYAEEMRRFAALCGMTIDSRLKAASAKVNEQQDQILAEFGI
jgi:P27 family predicted phage terminase small subunit